MISSDAIDRNGLHRMNLAGLRSALHALSPPAEICLVDGFRLGPTAPEHRAVVDGDERSAAIAAASIIAKVVRDRAMRRMDALYPRYGFVSHVGYITPAHSAKVREHGPSDIHRRSFQALCSSPKTKLARACASHLAAGRAAERRARLYFGVRGYRISRRTLGFGRSEIDLIVRRGTG